MLLQEQYCGFLNNITSLNLGKLKDLNLKMMKKKGIFVTFSTFYSDIFILFFV